MSKLFRNLSGPLAVVLVIGFVIFFALVPVMSDTAIARLFFGDGAADVLRVIVYGVPIALLLMLALLSFRSVAARRPAVGASATLDLARAADARVEEAVDEVEGKRRALVTHRFTCPRCGGNISYVEHALPIRCDVDDRHGWAQERALWEELTAAGNLDEAGRLERFVG
ncbi:hypothetical protein [Gulosibacter sp. 10]|uniref:hypothetical protein n=1 Tax=Gulosibacter sp. 10 TaxID=1255570 RepID=UPI00097EEF30|nr:hypothetical protein [Gulosibacter sp. 10]SJM67206.1 hypothetical protein FM112_12340 [Gulosibacter sp. 10]